MRSQGLHLHAKVTKNVEKCNLMKTSIFTRFSSHSGIKSWHDLHHKSLKKRPWDPNPAIGGSQHPQVSKLLQTRLQIGTPNPSKIIKNQHLDPKVASWVSPDTSRSPKWWPRVPKLHQKLQKWRRKLCSAVSERQVAVLPITQSCQSIQSGSQQVSQSANQQVTVTVGAGGTGRSH